MMNQMQQQQMGGMGSTPELTEEELRKLALLLQQMPEGEGLATVSSMEEQQMKDDGGAGTPLPGTQGLGPNGGQVKSYAKEDGRIDEDHRIAVLTDAEVEALNYLKNQDEAQGFQTGNGPMIQALAKMNTEDLEYYKYKGMQIPSLNGLGEGDDDDTGSGGYGGGSSSSSNSSSNSSSSGDSGGNLTIRGDSTENFPGMGGAGYGGMTSDYQTPEERRDKGEFETRPEVIQARNTAAGRSGDWNAHLEGGGDSGGGQGQADPPPPPKFKDMNGKEWNTQAEADASNAAIKAAMSGIEGQALTSDSTFARWTARNKDNETYAGLTAAQMETAYNTALTKSQEDASAQVPKMVESMNNFFAKTDADGNKIYNENTTYEEFVAGIGDALPANLSEATMRDMYANAVTKFQRGEAFTLTPEEVAEFERDAIQTATVDDAEGVTIGTVDDATTTTVGDVADVSPEDVEAIASITDEDIDAIFTGGTDKAEALLLARIDGTADSPAEQQLFRSSEQNLRMLLGATAGGDADPAKLRQLKNVWADMTQHAVGEAADLRSKESLAAESQLVELYRGKDTMKLNTKLANMEKDKQVAFKNGDFSLAGKLANQQTTLQKVITQASLDTNVKLANLEKAKTLAIEQGKLDLATNISNLQKNLTIATVDAKLAVTQRSMDDAVAMAAYEGQQALYGLEAQIDTETMKADLTEMGFELSRDLAELDSATQIKVAEMTKQWRNAQGDDAKQAAIIGAIGTVIAGYASAGSDINMKTNIAPGSGEVESFLDALNSYKYEYKDENAPGADAGMFVGVMAQDLEKTAMGASFVKDTPNGKMVDYGHGLAAILASQANIHDRIRHLEEG
jgi:hypothetical protein